MTKEECMTFWMRAKDRLKANNLSIKSFALASGISVNTIYSQVRQGIAPGIEEFMILVGITKSDPYWLIWGDNPPTEVKGILASYSETHPGLNEDSIASLEKQMQDLIAKLKDSSSRE